jgi:DNA-binding transcriptional ArsR family regulator
MALPNLWGLYNLRSSPYFQATLRSDTEATPLGLFVGRERERQLLLTTIGSTRSSRQAVAGRPGIGKTTLVQAVKADAREAGYWTSSEIISLGSEASSEDLLGRLLHGAYDAVLASFPAASGPAVEAAQQLVRSFRLRGGGFSASAFGFGAGGTQTEGVSTPPSALVLDGPRVLRDLLAYAQAQAQGAQGLVLHLNNLENLSEADADRAADLLRSIRDQALLLDGLHLIVVGTTDAVRTVVQTHTQIRSVFSDPQVLQPLELKDVQKLLANRYAALQLGPEQPWRSPVEDAVVERLYLLFRGDLRGMLKALEDGMTALLGLTAPAASDGTAPVGMDDLLLVLRQRNQQELKDQLGPTAWERLLAWGNRDPEACEIQTALKTLWGVSQSAVSQTLQQLTASGAVEALPRKGRDPIQYMLTGTARLAF